MSDSRTTIVPIALAGERLDKAAALLFEGHSRAELTRWIQQGALTVDGAGVKPRHRLHGGEVLCLGAERREREAWQAPQEMALEVVYEDEHVLVINKPPGLVVHPGAGNPDQTLVNGLLSYRPELTRLPRAGIVHRLDKDTSGVMVVAASELAQTDLSQQISKRTARRSYLGLCEGRMIAGRDVDAAIGRDPHVRTRQAVRDDGKPAYTEIRVRHRYRTHTLVAATLRTGRTHQIRVHMKSIGHPLVGDRRYGARGVMPAMAADTLVAALKGFPRQALHAHELSFDHPESGAPMNFTVPLAEDMNELMRLLREDLAGHGQESGPL